MKLQRGIDQPVRAGLSWEERWQGPDGGLIACWEAGRELGVQKPAQAAMAQHGQLIPLPWKGGLEPPKDPPNEPTKATKVQKYGCFQYLAMWQGLRGDALFIDTTLETRLTCSVLDRTVVFTPDRAKYAAEVI